ncbi:MAG: ATP-dependent helicase [Candidatus Tectomicrobia bacterium]|nr:ATP-dependent helicase [Candidatus Tectomicrobia bacterium]
MKFTPAQLDAINHTTGNLQLVACAGSGKTEVIARRVANLLKPGTPDAPKPANIVAFTFTEKAAAELKERIVTRCRELIGDLPGLAEMYVGTIHAFCLDLLKTEVPIFLKYEVLNEVQQALFIDRHSRQSGLTATTDLYGRRLRRYTDTSRYLTALWILRESRLVDRKLRGCSVVNGLCSYRELLNQKSYFDYSAIMEEAFRALQDDNGVRRRVGSRIRHVIVDEYQDVNPIQERVVEILHDLGAKVCVVGDDDQTIYQWRGSDVGNILSFADRYPEVKQVRLEENFRSSQGVVETARDFIKQNGERLDKAMIPMHAQVYETGDIVALWFDSADAEAAYIAETILTLQGVAVKDGGGERGISWSDMAILLRSVKANGEPITRALAAAGIPYVVAGMNNLFGTPEAEAARQVFYFMAARPGVSATTLEAAWVRARVGVRLADLRHAIANVENDRAALDEPDQKRWGFYSLQRQFLTFLEDAAIREEKVPEDRGVVVFYNLGKFSQLISDFETIHYHSKPIEKYDAFASFLQHKAEDAYPEGWQDNQYANPEAVRVMTIHQAKGMQWPVVFVPALLKNRFPAKKPGGRSVSVSVWHLLPAEAVEGQERYEGTIEDERRLFYVAMTRSQKFLHLTWGPVPGNQLFQKVSEFWVNILASKWVKRRRADYGSRKRLSPTPRPSVANVVLSFSDLKYFFECPYQFKLRILYGFNAPIHEALGYGKSLHDALAEVHARAMRGDVASASDVPRLVETHLHTPYAYPALREKLEKAAEKVLGNYLHDNRDLFDKIEFSEKTVAINLGGGVSVIGRIDLVRRIDTGETTIVDLKSTDRAQAEDVTETQLHVYALGYQDLTGRRADFVEIYNLDERKRKPRAVDNDFLDEVKDNVRSAAQALREGAMTKKPDLKKCRDCDYRRMCSEGAKLDVARRGGSAP